MTHQPRQKLFFFFSFCLASQLSFGQSISQLKFINEFDIPHNQNYKNTTIGGLSGIDFDQTHQLYYLLSDDRSDINPSRFYTAKIKISEKGIDTVVFEGLQFLLNANREKYSSFKQHPAAAVDPEDIRFNTKTNQLYWVSEGERIITEKKALANPSIILANTNGSYVRDFPLPSILTMQSIEKGPRRNGTLEGITFDQDFKTLYAALEEPLFEDGPRADLEKTNSLVRIFQFDVESKKNEAQYAYLLEPVAHPAIPENNFKVNGISEILYLSKNQLLVVERSYSAGRLPCTVKIFLADLSQADDVKDIPSLKEKQSLRLVKKNLLLNMDDLGIYIDNVEGVTFGPTLGNGHRTLIFVTDDNFQPKQKTQLLLFEIIP